MNTSSLSAFASLSLAMVIVGSSVVFGKIITEAFPVFLASGLRFGIASVFLVPILFKKEKQLVRLSLRDTVHLVVMAFSGQFVFTVLVLLGLRYTSAVEAGLITSSSPGMMAVAAYLLFREKPGLVKILAILAVVAGVILVNGVFKLEYSASDVNHMMGNLMMVGAVAGEAVFLLMRKRISDRVSDLALTAYLCIAGLIMFLPFSVFQAVSFDFAAVTRLEWLSILYFGAVFTVLAYLLWFNGVSRVSGATAGIFTAVMPVSAVLLSILFLGETFSRHHAMGGALIILSILVVSIDSNAKAKKSCGLSCDT